MLKQMDFEDDFREGQADQSHLLQVAFYWEFLKRRWVYFFVPFVSIAAAGVVAAIFWPPTYLSEGKILVESQLIPTELVRPTVTNAAQERIQVIEQRTMTRDNLVAIVDKFQLFPAKRPLMSVTELVDLMRKSTKIVPVDLTLDFKQRSRLDNPTIVFSVGFEYPDAQTATRVANELVTRILNEDLRDRTNRATDTTKFLSREVQKLQADSAALDAKIAQQRLLQAKPPGSKGADQPAVALNSLKTELTEKGALYSEKHPAVQALKKQVEAMEKAASSAVTEPADMTDLDALLIQQEALQKNLELASAKLSAARLGENLEKNQQSEKLEVIEQPTVPQEPVRPNRPKVAGVAVIVAFLAGAGLAFAAEVTDQSIRRGGDVLGVIEGELIVSIPYIVTAAELRRRRRLIILLVLATIVLLIGLLTLAYFFLPPIDLIIAKARVGLFK